MCGGIGNDEIGLEKVGRKKEFDYSELYEAVIEGVDAVCHN